MPRTRLKWVAGAAVLLAVLAGTTGAGRAALHGGGRVLQVWWAQLHGANPDPVRLLRPHPRPPTPLAALGKSIFFDGSLSVSGTRSCAFCHEPSRGYGPPDGLPAQFGGADLKSQGQRAVPSLSYLSRVPAFRIGPDSDDDFDRRLPRPRRPVAVTSLPQVKSAGQTPAVQAMVPQGGLFWDGRANSLQAQAAGPLLNPLEMGNHDLAAVAADLVHAPYGDQFAKLFGQQATATPQQLANIALIALAYFQIEDSSFHPYSSKFDYWLEGKARFTRTEMRGYRAFNDPKKANCAACHVDAPRRDWQPPLFTDNQYEALGVPRNAELLENRDPDYFDLGICGPQRADMQGQTQYCGMFRTPSLRNVARRSVFFHNGRYHSLREVLEFYNFRDTAPERIHPRKPDGSVAVFDDLPPQYRANVDVKDAPFDRRPGDPPPMSDRDMDDIIAFLQTLSDGYELPR